MPTKKSSKFLLTGIILAMLVGIGYIWYDNYQKEFAEPAQKELEKEMLIVEEQLALYIVQNYEDVNKIQFRKLAQTKETGYWHVTADINDDQPLNFSMTNLSPDSEPSVRYNPSKFKLTRKADGTKNLSTVEVIYSENLRE